MAGFCRILREEKDPQARKHMLDYLIALMEDANDFSCDAARASHAVLLCRMEPGEVKGYSEIDKLDGIRRANAQRHVTTSPSEAQNSQKKLKSSKVLTHTSIRAHLSTKDHIIPKVLCTGTFATIVFNKLEKHTHILNKTVGIKIPKRKCPKTNNLGRTKGCSHPKNSVESCI